VIAEKHGGPTTLNNLAVSCVLCNLRKGSDLSSIDPDSGLVSIFSIPAPNRGRITSELTTLKSWAKRGTRDGPTTATKLIPTSCRATRIASGWQIPHPRLNLFDGYLPVVAGDPQQEILARSPIAVQALVLLNGRRQRRGWGATVPQFVVVVFVIVQNP
jgi:hypothetical protein